MHRIRIGSLPRPTALVPLIVAASALVGCGQGQEPEAGQYEPDRPSPGEAGAAMGTELSPPEANSGHRPAGTALDPDRPDPEVTAPADVTLPGFGEGDRAVGTDALGGAGAANARGAAVDASASPTEAAETGSAPEGAVRGSEPDDDPSIDSSVDADSP